MNTVGDRPAFGAGYRLRNRAFVALLLLVPGALAAPPEAQSFADAVQQLADANRALRLDSWDDYLAWRAILRAGAAETTATLSTPALRNDLVRFLARRAPISHGPELQFATSVSALERLQIAALPAVSATGDRTYLPVLNTLYRRHIAKENWPLAEEIRLIIRSLNGDAPQRSIYDGRTYYRWLKQQGYYRTIQSLSSEADLEERTPAGLTRLTWATPAGTPGPNVPYDESRARRIFDRLGEFIRPDYLNENLLRWFQFGGPRPGAFRLSWAIHDVRFYLQGWDDSPGVLVVLVDETFPDVPALQARLGDVLSVAGVTFARIPAENQDISQSVGSAAHLRVGLRSLRQGLFTAVRLEW